MAITIGVTGNSLTEAQAQLRELLSELEPNAGQMLTIGYRKDALKTRLEEDWNDLSRQEQSLLKLVFTKVVPGFKDVLPEDADDLPAIAEDIGKGALIIGEFFG